jgi:D-tagatose-1,6-bisphosphate aldolase subunit GatZ/KbaZ
MPEGSLKDALLGEMARDPRHWKAYYLDPERRDFDLQFSLSDRIRYYWAAPAVERACSQLFEVLAATGIPLTLLSQYLPVQYAAIRERRLENTPRALILDGIEQVLRNYDRACRPTRAAHTQAWDES